MLLATGQTLELDLRSALHAAWPKLAPFQRDSFQTLFESTDHSATATQIAKLLGVTHVVTVNKAIGGVGSALLHAGGRRLPRNTYGPWNIVATGQVLLDGRFLWTMRPELVRAAFQLGLGPRENDPALETAEDLVEGARRRVVVNGYERHPRARARCIEAHGTACAVCSTTLSDRYGAIAQGYVHVHHVTPIAAHQGEAYELDPVADLRPVCPNCHAILHLRSPPLAIDELQRIIGGFAT